MRVQQELPDGAWSPVERKERRRPPAAVRYCSLSLVLSLGQGHCPERRISTEQRWRFRDALFRHCPEGRLGVHSPPVHSGAADRPCIPVL